MLSMSRRLLLTSVTGIVLVISSLLLPQFTVYGFPRPGHYFYGKVTVDGTPVPPGTLITLSVAGMHYQVTVDDQGRYGYSPGTCKIPADDPDTPEREGARPYERISFFVDGQVARLYAVEIHRWRATYLFEEGGMTELDLDVGEWVLGVPVIVKQTG